MKSEATEGCISHCGIAWSFLGEVGDQRPHRWCISLIPCHLDPKPTIVWKFYADNFRISCLAVEQNFGSREAMSVKDWFCQVRRLAPQYILMDIASPDAIFLRAAMANMLMY